jgi:hypothetical protein
LTDDEQLKKILGEVEKFGTLECVLYNAARVAGKPPLEESGEEIEADFKVRGFFSFSSFVLEVSAGRALLVIY